MNRDAIAGIRCAYGLDYSGSFAAVVRVEQRRGGWRVERVLREEHVDSGSTFQTVATALAAAVPFRRALLSAAMPARDSAVRRLTAPFASVSKARKVWPSLLDIQLPFPLESCAVEFLDTRKVGSQVETMAVLAREERLADRLEALAACKMDPHVLDHEGLALWTRSLEEVPSSGGVRLVVYLGLDRTVWVMGSGQDWLGSHASRLGRDDLGSEAALADWRDRTARLLRAHAVSGQEPIALYWVGPGAEDRALCARLEEALASVGVFTGQPHDDPSLFLARALAFRALTAGPSRLNFRDLYKPHPDVVRWGRASRRSLAWTLFVAGLLLCVGNGLFAYQADRQDRALRAEVQGVARTLSGYPTVSYGQEVLIVERALAEQKKGLAPFQAAFDRSASRDLAVLLRASSAAGVRFDSVALRGGQWTVQGTMTNEEEGALLVDGLREQGWQVNLDRRDDDAGAWLRFRLTAEGGGG